MSGELPAGLTPLLGGYLARQRWYAGPSVVPGPVDLVEGRGLLDADGTPRLWWAVVEVEGDLYQLLIGERHAGETADFLQGQEWAVIGSGGEHYYYDATLDADLALPLLGVISGGEQHAKRVRPITAEQSNTSLVYDDRLIVKIFRRVRPGQNREVEITTALRDYGFDHVPEPVFTWRSGDFDLALGQEFLAGGTEGWSLALTSLRDFYASTASDPAESGGDFAAEAGRLGEVTARLHLALAEAYPRGEHLSEQAWLALVDDLAVRLATLSDEAAGFPDEDLTGQLRAELALATSEVLATLREPGDRGLAIVVHGDYHLGQVMRTDTGWYVLDFEGEPAREAEHRQAVSSPYRDVAGMVRSFQYAARFALWERAGQERAQLEAKADAWESHAREAFWDGYHTTEGIAALLPVRESDRQLVAWAYELDKALYEFDYERAYRPDWWEIPVLAIRRLLASFPGPA